MAEHGTLSRYVNEKCRCERCQEANRAYHRIYRTKGSPVPKDVTTDTAIAYQQAVLGPPTERTHAACDRMERILRADAATLIARGVFFEDLHLGDDRLQRMYDLALHPLPLEDERTPRRHCQCGRGPFTPNEKAEHDREMHPEGVDER